MKIDYLIIQINIVSNKVSSEMTSMKSSPLRVIKLQSGMKELQFNST